MTISKRDQAKLNKAYPKYDWDREMRPHCKKCGSIITIETLPGGPLFFMHYAKCAPRGFDE